MAASQQSGVMPFMPAPLSIHAVMALISPLMPPPVMPWIGCRCDMRAQTLLGESPLHLVRPVMVPFLSPNGVTSHLPKSDTFSSTKGTTDNSQRGDFSCHGLRNRLEMSACGHCTCVQIDQEKENVQSASARTSSASPCFTYWL